MLSYNYLTMETFAQSSPYMRQVIEDPVGDIKSSFTKNTTGKQVTYISTTSSCLKNNSASLDIESTSFRSDGNTLRSMIWLRWISKTGNCQKQEACWIHNIFVHKLNLSHRSGLSGSTFLEQYFECLDISDHRNISVPWENIIIY